ALAAQQAPQAPAGGAAAPQAPAPKPAPQPQPKPEDIVLAKVGPAVVTEADFQAVLAQLPQQQQMMVQIVQGAKEELVNRIVERKLLALEAEAKGLDKSPEYLRALAQTQDDLLAREFLRSETPALQAKMKVSDAEVKAYYDAHAKDFTTPAKATARHILVMVKGPATQGKGMSEAEAKKKIAEIQKRLKAGRKLRDLVKQYSDDPGSKDKGGLYEDFDPKTMDPAFAKAVETQPLGKVGAPVKSMYGYHLIEVEKRTPAAPQTFEEAKAQAEEAATKARQEQVWKELVADLRKKYPVTITMPKAQEAPAEAPAPQAAPEAGQAPEAGK
ncbi:MAG TPA: peptidylprolyl isomerase, partial [Holophagaceae bacterium]|nr:peptidylprolyl isomerase [Holophagaceae bacterium]